MERTGRVVQKQKGSWQRKEIILLLLLLLLAVGVKAPKLWVPQYWRLQVMVLVLEVEVKVEVEVEVDVRVEAAVGERQQGGHQGAQRRASLWPSCDGAEQWLPLWWGWEPWAPARQGKREWRGEGVTSRRVPRVMHA